MHKYTNEKEILEALERQTLLIEQKLNKGLMKLEALDKDLPSTISISTYQLADFRPVYFGDEALELMGVSSEEFFLNPIKSVQKNGFPGDFLKNKLLVSQHLLGNRKHQPISYIQKVKIGGKKDYEGLYTLSKKNELTNELLNIYVVVPELSNSTPKLFRALEEELIVKRSYHKFINLTVREKEIITLLATGFQSNEIADQLFISKATVEQHRKNLKRKLEIKRFVDLMRFAQAFDLI
ncbi:MAG TPA: helix-turn-helix transcriptional regulator [Microscillaceae bacterium]|nr:helix-turn-helix transcriptional regulator [Microscillaceae bacterium]